MNDLFDEHQARNVLATLILATVDYSNDDAPQEAVGALVAAHEASQAQAEREARIAELQDFSPFFTANHAECLDPKACVGYINAVSDFENEREIRLAQLETLEADHKHDTTDFSNGVNIFDTWGCSICLKRGIITSMPIPEADRHE